MPKIARLVNLEPFTGPGSTPNRRRFWDQVTQAVIASQKVAGHNVTTDEHEGMGTFVNVADSSARGRRRGGGGQTGACCDEENNCTITTESDCEGTFQGVGTICDPNPCGAATGACCIDGECSILSSAACASGGGTYHGDGSTCTENLCCTLCGPILSPACFDGTDYWTGEGCDGCIGEIVPSDSNWLVDSEYCVGEDVDCSELCSITTFDPVTCEGTVECFSNDCCASCVNGGVHTVSSRTFPCPELSPPP